MSKQDIKISVITVVKNAAGVIERCLTSILNQSHKNIETIVIDGRSTDGTLDILKKFSLSRLVSEPDSGLYDAMNKGLGLATGDYIHFLNADDHYHDSEVLSRLLPYLDSNRIIYGDILYTEMNGLQRRLGGDFDWKTELRHSTVPQPSLLVPTSYYRLLGGFNRRYAIAADYEMVLRLAKNYPLQHVPEVITVMHAGGVSYQRTLQAFSEARQIAVSYGRWWPAAWMGYWFRCLKWRLSQHIPIAWRYQLRQRSLARLKS